MTRSLLRSRAALLVFLAAACSAEGEPPAPLPADAALSTSGADAPADPSCTASRVTWASPTSTTEACSGPWEYERNAWCTLHDPACGPLECPLGTDGTPQWATCARWEFGTIMVNDRRARVGRFPVGGDCAYDRELRRVICNPPFDAGADRCEQYAADQLAAIRSGLPADKQSLVSITSSSHTFVATGTRTWDVECRVTTRYPRPWSRKDPTCGCAVALEHPACSVQRPACGPSGTRVLSPPGLSQTALLASDAQGAFGATGAHAIECTTCEQLPMGTPDEARAKYACLRASWDAVPSARAALARNLRHVYELRGDALDETARAFVRDVYRDWAGAPLACGAAPGVPELALECPSSAEDVRGALARCARLAEGHVPATVAALEAPSCLDALALAGSIDGPDCDGAAAREALRASATTLVARALGLIARPAAEQVDGLGALPRELWLLDRWDTAIVASYAVDPGAEEIPGIRSEMLGRFWRHAQAQRAVLSDLASAGAAVEDALEESTARGLALDRDVIVAALTPVTTLPAARSGSVDVEAPIAVGGAPARGDLLLIVVGDALSGLEDRLEDLAAYHDVACQFSRCEASPTPTRLARFYRLLAALDDATALSAEIAAAPPTETLDGWRPAFTAIEAGHAELAAALDAHQIERPITEIDPDRVAAPARSFVRIVLSAESRRRAYATTGLLDATDRRTLFAGVDDRQRAVVMDRVEDAVADLEGDLAEYESDLGTVVSGVLSQVGTEAAAGRIRAERLRIGRRQRELASDLAGLQASADADAQQFADIAGALVRIDGAIDDGGYVPVGDTVHLEFDASDASYDGSASTITEIAAASMQAGAGEIVAIEATGAGVWAPTCALSRVRTVGEGGVMVPLPTAGITTGPEGYSVMISNTGANATSASHQSTSGSTTSYGANVKVCASYGFDVPVFGVEAEACAHAGWEHTSTTSDTESWSNDQSTSWSAQFASGLRLPITPFPELPVGSLLVIEMPRGTTARQQEIDVHVVRAPRTQILVRQDADLYFVVNDTECVGADTIHALTFDARRFASAQAIADAVTDEMQATLEDLRALEPAIVAQGTILPTQMAALRSSAVVALEARTGMAYASLPPSLAGLFEAFLDREILRLERASHVRALEREIDGLLLELEILRVEEELAAREGRLAQLVPGWTLRNMDGDRLRDSARDLVVLSRRHLYPVIDLWYPEALDDLDVEAAAAPLLVAGPSSRTLDLVTHVRALVDTVLSHLAAAAPGYKETPFRPLVALSFVRPGVVADPFTPISSLPKADPERAQLVWEQIEATGTASITVRPEDVYTLYGGAGGLLACTEAVPVIQRAALFVVRPGGAVDTADLNDERRFVTGRASTTQPFAEEDGPVVYTLGNAAWQRFQVPLLYGTYTGALSTFVERALGSSAAELPEGPVGLSPFGQLEVDFQALAGLRAGALGDGITTPGLEATEIVLVMQVDSRSTGAPLSWVPQCAP